MQGSLKPGQHNPVDLGRPKAPAFKNSPESASYRRVPHAVCAVENGAEGSVVTFSVGQGPSRAIRAAAAAHTVRGVAGWGLYMPGKAQQAIGVAGPLEQVVAAAVTRTGDMVCHQPPCFLPF